MAAASAHCAYGMAPRKPIAALRQQRVIGNKCLNAAHQTCRETFGYISQQLIINAEKHAKTPSGNVGAPRNRPSLYKSSSNAAPRNRRKRHKREMARRVLTATVAAAIWQLLHLSREASTMSSARRPSACFHAVAGNRRGMSRNMRGVDEQY